MANASFGVGALLVDGANIAYVLKDVGLVGMPFRISYGRLAALLQRKCSTNIRYRCYYGTYIGEDCRERRAAFRETLSKSGFTAFEFQTKQCADGRHRDKQVDIEIALDAYQLGASGSISHLFLMTHDTDFAAVFRRLRSKVRCYAVGWEQFMAKELKESAEPFYLNNMAKEIEYL